MEKKNPAQRCPLVIGLCKGRHELPVDDYVFETIVDPTDYDWMRSYAEAVLDDRFERGNHGAVVLYVTGLTAALGAVVRYCSDRDIPLALQHYDREADAYWSQIVIAKKRG